MISLLVQWWKGRHDDDLLFEYRENRNLISLLRYNRQDAKHSITQTVESIKLTVDLSERVSELTRRNHQLKKRMGIGAQSELLREELAKDRTRNEE